MTDMPEAVSPQYPELTYSPSEELLERLATDPPSEEAIMDFLRGQRDHTLQLGYGAVSIHDYFRGVADLEAYAEARTWWPKDAPAQFACPSIYQLCVNYTQNWPELGNTFYERLTTYATRAAKWLTNEGRDPANPSETSEERKRRLNAEAQQRHRDRKQGGAEGEHARAVGAAYRAYMDVCAERKAVKAEWDKKVKAAREAWQELKAKPRNDAGV